MHSVTESIYASKSVIIPLADVQHSLMDLSPSPDPAGD